MTAKPRRDFRAETRRADERWMVRRYATTAFKVLALFLLVCSPILLLRGGLRSAEIDPVLVRGQTVYVLNCRYKDVLHEYKINVAPLRADPAGIDKTACPKALADARKSEVTDPARADVAP